MTACARGSWEPAAQHTLPWLVASWPTTTILRAGFSAAAEVMPTWLRSDEHARSSAGLMTAFTMGDWRQAAQTNGA